MLSDHKCPTCGALLDEKEVSKKDDRCAFCRRQAGERIEQTLRDNIAYYDEVRASLGKLTTKESVFVPAEIQPQPRQIAARCSICSAELRGFRRILALTTEGEHLCAKCEKKRDVATNIGRKTEK